MAAYVLGSFATVCALSTATLVKLSLPRRLDVNMYYTTSYFLRPEQMSENNVQIAPPLDALVLSSGLLDEALIGLSIEPLVFGFLSPELRERLTPSMRPTVPPRRSGEGFSLPFVMLTVLQYLSAPVTAFFLRASRGWVQPFVTELILDTASAVGFGLPVRKFADALVTPKRELQVEGVFDAGEVWDVTKIIAAPRSISRPPAKSVEFDFLWNDDKLKEKLAKSSIWEKVQSKLDDIKVRADRTKDGTKYDLEIKRLCAILEERARELVRMTELYHSRYYSDERIIQAIARFLEDGTRPTPLT